METKHGCFWSEEEVNFLKNNYGKMTDEEIGMALFRSKGSISSKRKELKLKIRKKIKYSEEEAKNQLVKIFNELGRLPTKEDGKKIKMIPARDWYVDKYGSVENAGVYFGLVDSPLSMEERIDVSLKELKEIAKTLNRIPLKNEYEDMRKDGYSITPLIYNTGMTYKGICEKYLSEYVIVDLTPEGYKRCSICKEIKPLNEFNVDSDQKTGVTSCCKVCAYVKRNGLIVPNNWSKKECLIIIDNIINEKILYLNDLCNVLTNKTLEDFIELLSNGIKIGNKHLNIKTQCAYCGKEEIKHLGTYINNKNCFCSLECYWNYKKEFEPTGEEHHSYNRIKTTCTNCGKDIEVIPYNFNIINENGDNHNFCSQECYWEYRGKYYTGENHPQFGIERTEEQKQRQRIITTNLYSTGVFNRQTKPQKVVNYILDDLHIEYKNEFNCKYYAVDNYLLDYNLIIEVMGDYFHANPIKFKEINDMQFKDIVKDKRKRTYVKKYKEINILYLWENDIKNNLELIEPLIKYYVSNKGKIVNYDSFNYFLHEDVLLVNVELIKPYIDYTAKELNIIKKDKVKTA